MALNRYWTAKELSRELAENHGIRLGARRIEELARLGHMPYATCGQDGPLYFAKTAIKDWIAAHLIHEWKPCPREVLILDMKEFRLKHGVPAELAAMQGQLCEVPIRLFRDPAIYFLVKKDRVVYVGRSDNLLGRLGSHLLGSDFDHVYFLPVPKDDLSTLEIAFIRALQPPMNVNRYSSRWDVDSALILERYGMPTGEGDGDTTHATPSEATLGQAREQLPDGRPGADQVLPGDRAG